MLRNTDAAIVRTERAHMPIHVLIAAVFMLVAAAGAGCQSVSMQVRPDFNPTDALRVTVLPFSGEQDDLGDLATITGAISERLVGCGVALVERERVTRLKDERGGDFDYADLGRVLGVDIAIAGGADVGASVREASFRGIQTSDGVVLFGGTAPAGRPSRRTGHDIGDAICRVLNRGPAANAVASPRAVR